MHVNYQTVSMPVDRAAHWLPGSTLGPWRLDQRLGEGTWTEVFSAAPLDATSNSPADYAIKAIKPNFADDPRAIAMLQREAFLGRTISHPHLACVLSAHVDRSPRYLVLPFQRGATLRDYLAAAPRLATSQSLWIVRQTAEALGALHGQNWLHGDVKPANIYVARNGHVTLCDLGFARRVDEVRSHPSLAMGSPSYLAPEALHSALSVSPATDIYALGVVLFELLTGTRPFPQTDEADLADAHRLLPPPNPRIWVPQLCPSIGRLLRRMLAKEPLRRPVGSELIEWLVDLEIESFDERC